MIYIEIHPFTIIALALCPFNSALYEMARAISSAFLNIFRVSRGQWRTQLTMQLPIGLLRCIPTTLVVITTFLPGQWDNAIINYATTTCNMCLVFFCAWSFRNFCFHLKTFNEQSNTSFISFKSVWWSIISSTLCVIT